MRIRQIHEEIPGYSAVSKDFEDRRLEKAKAVLELCSRLKARLPKSAPMLNQVPLPLTQEELELAENTKKMYAERGIKLSMEDAIERSHIQRRYEITPEKRANDYERAACNLCAARLEDRIINALRGNPSEEFYFAEWVEIYTEENFGVPDKYNLTGYAKALHDLHRILIGDMKRNRESYYVEPIESPDPKEAYYVTIPQPDWNLSKTIHPVTNKYSHPLVYSPPIWASAWGEHRGVVFADLGPFRFQWNMGGFWYRLMNSSGRQIDDKMLDSVGGKKVVSGTEVDLITAQNQGTLTFVRDESGRIQIKIKDVLEVPNDEES